MKNNLLKTWLLNAREAATAQSTVPSILAVVLAVGAPGFNVWMAILAVLGVKCAHLAMNLIDDLHDYHADMLGDRVGVVREGFKAYTAKYPYLVDGSSSEKGLKAAIAVFGGVALLCGAGIVAFRALEGGLLGFGVLTMAACVLFTVILGWFYSAPPLKLAFRGAGEVVIGLIFGPLLMTGMSVAAAGEVLPQIAIFSIPVGILVMNILYTHSFIDEKGDKASGKLTLAGLIPSNGGKLAVSVILNLLPFVLVVTAVAFGMLHPAFLAVLLALPRAIWLIHSLAQFTHGVDVEPAKWLGPMGNWEAIKAAGLAWYLSRWFTARNLVTLFCVVTVLVQIVLLIVK